MFRTEETSLARLARTALPAGIALLLVALAICLADIVARGREVALAAVALGLLGAAAVALAVGWRAWASADRRLRELKVFAADVLESLSTGAITLDLAGRVTAVNGRAGALLGIDPRRTRVPYAQAFERSPVLCGAAETLLERETEIRDLDVTVPGAGPDGASRTLRLDGSFLETEDGRRIGAVIQVADVTQLRAIEGEVRRSERLASLGTLAASVAHEIRNPLAALDIHLQLLREALAAPENGGGGAPPGAAAERCLRVVESEVRRLDGIVESFIRFARPKPARRAPTDLAALVEETAALVEPECRRQGIRLERALGAARPVAHADEGELKQALLNVLLNAVQAMPGGGTLGIALETGGAGGAGATVGGGAVARIVVRDTGPGIPARVRDRIFDLFFTTREGGTGLGLPMAKKALLDHGGDVAFETGDAGTTFTLVVPLRAPGAATPAPVTAEAPAPC